MIRFFTFIFNWIYKLIIRFVLFIIILATLFLVANSIGSLLLTSSLRNNELGQIGIYNPYEGIPPNQYNSINNRKDSNWQKVALHIHSNQVWYTPERQSLSDLVQSYRRNGFNWISISDYNLVTDIRSWNEKSFLSYEWSTSILKRHFLFVGVKSAITDPFYFFSTRENIQWVIDQNSKQDAFVVSNHPNLFNSMPLDFLISLSGVHAVEIFSPFGDHHKLIDHLLEQGKPIFTMATDDLHYLPPEESELNNESKITQFWKMLSFVKGKNGQAFERFILIPNSNNNEQLIYKALCKGEYASVKKFHRNFADFPLTNISFNNNIFKIEFLEKVKEIRIITGSGNPAKIFENVLSAEYKMKAEDNYVRADVLDWRGILVTNPVYRTEKMELRPSCKL